MATTAPIVHQEKNRRRTIPGSRMEENATRSMVKTNIFFTCGRPCRGLGENASDRNVPARKNASGNQMGGRRSFAREASSATRERPSRAWEMLIEMRIATAAAKTK